MKVTVCGLGEIGLAVAKYLQPFKHLEVYGYDISPKATRNAGQHGIHASVIWRSIPPSQVYIICVSTTPTKYDNGMANIINVANQIKRHMNSHNPLILVESTILPGTCETLNELFHGEACIAHFPHRYWNKDTVNYGVKQLRVLGAINDESLKHAVRFIKKLHIPFHVVSTVEVAELCKLVENAFRFYEVSFAEELCLACSNLGIDFEAVRTACNTKIRCCKLEHWQVQIPEARDGVGGHCLPKDTQMLARLSPFFHALQSAVETDQVYKVWKLKMNAPLLPS